MARPRCPVCGKVDYRNRETAERVAREHTRRWRDRKHRMRVYRGACGRWHLTRTKTMLEHLERAGRTP